jgi:protein-L-isoaspartate(D-aspartate) O-methyltransferase
MDAFAQARRMMVDGQLRTNDVTNPYLIAAFENVPRERFVPEAKRALAYLDLDLPVSPDGSQGPVRYLLKPLVLAKLLEIAEVKSSDTVLDVGCATGYSSAILAQIAASVVAIEGDAALAAQATGNLSALGVTNAVVETGPLTEGARQVPDRRFDVILLNGAVEVIPEALERQLAEGGRLICVKQEGPVGRGMLFTATKGHISGRAVFDSVAPLLPGFARKPAFVF